MVTIVDPKPSEDVLKKVVCRNCGVKLQYVPNDVKERKSYDYTGSFDYQYYIDCPNCNTKVIVNSR
jgi:DNA-directed RNA polymerase subunit RPC12/RpoP